MRRPEYIARQSSCPTGVLGRVIARIMAVETAAANAQALALLALQPNDHVLDVGCGHGRTIARAAAAVPEGFAAGIDLSDDMVRMAKRRNRHWIAPGRVEVRRGDSGCIPYPDRRFDKVYSVHTLYFWPDPVAHLREIHRVMKPGARFVLGFGPRDDEQATADFPATVYRFYTSDEVRTLLAQAGFVTIEMLARSISSRRLAFAVAHSPPHLPLSPASQ